MTKEPDALGGYLAIADKEVTARLSKIRNPHFLNNREKPIVMALIDQMRTFLISAQIQKRHTKKQRFLCPAHFILTFGRYFKGIRPIPKGFRWMTPKECLSNSQQLAIRREDVTYVEGVVTSVIGAITHAWVSTDKHELVDVTLRPLSKPDKQIARALFKAGYAPSLKKAMQPLGTIADDANREYFGVAFNRDYIWHVISETEVHCSLIDNWHMNWPLMDMDDKAIAKVLSSRPE